MLSNEGSPSSNEMKGKPWGFWATLGFSAIISGLFLGLQTLVAVVFVFIMKGRHPQLDLEVYTRSLPSNGLCIAIMVIATALICIPLTLLFAKLRKNISVRNYIGFRLPLKKQWVKWLLVLVAFLFLSDTVSTLLGQPIVNPFMADIYKTSSFLPLLLVALMVASPMFEEIFFRGFLFQGIRYSRLGPIAAIGITSLFWAAIHLQYNLYGMATIFALGLLLGIVRIKTDSIYLLMAMHSLSSLAATIETALYVHFVG